MADGIVIWSKSPVNHELTLWSLLKAAYDSKIIFRLDGYNEYYENEKAQIIPLSITLLLDFDESKFMIFYLSTLQDQNSGLEKWINTKFVKKNGIEIIKPVLYRIAVSEDFDNEMLFNFAYNYLKNNKKNMISIFDFAIDWAFMKSVYTNGFKPDWLEQLKTCN